jgi:hypothetical protein
MEKHTLCRRITSGWRRPIRSRIGRQIEWLSDHIGEWMFIPFDDTRQEDRPCDSEAMWLRPLCPLALASIAWNGNESQRQRWTACAQII